MTDLNTFTPVKIILEKPTQASINLTANFVNFQKVDSISSRRDFNITVETFEVALIYLI